MRPSLFDHGQSVLLVGEGNFSFSVELVKLALNLKLTSCCFEKQPVFASSEENILFLKNQGVCVLLNIDATRLSEYEELSSQIFHRIVFNFPHVGGKTKIQLNRELLCKFFKNCSRLLSQEGTVVVSLCRGQGGSHQETVVRQYADTWKVVEMAAHGGFVLSAVEPWIENSSLGSYSCVGRRSLDSSFRRDGALVHIFRFASNKLVFQPVDKYLDILVPKQIEFPDGVFNCSYLQSSLLKRGLLFDSSSTPHKLLQNLKVYIMGKSFQITCKELPVVSDDLLSHTIEMEYLLKLLKLEENSNNSQLLHLHWGIAFQEVRCDFSKAPVFCYAALKGSESFSVCQEWLIQLSCPSEVLSDVIVKLGSSICLLLLDKLAIHLFHLSDWRELWASGAKVVSDDKGNLSWESASLSPPIFSFDLSLKTLLLPDINAICYVLWQLAGEFIKCVEVLDIYKSPEGWYSKCIRITYCSYEMPLHRSLVIKLQHEVIGPVLQLHLGVIVR